jgi:hypothetical protein
MPGRMSNKERIARAAAEKAAGDKEKAVKKKKKTAKKKSTRKKTSRASKSAPAKSAGRMRLVWVVCDQTGGPVKEYPYPERSEADAEAARLTSTKGKQHFVRKEKVPME